MNSRERIRASLSHQPVDRVPIDLGGTRQSGIAALAYARVRRALGLEDSRPFQIFDLYQQLAEIEQDVLDRFQSDCLPINRLKVGFGIENRDWKPWTLHDGTPVLVPGAFNPETEPDGSLVLKKNGEVAARMPRNGLYFDRFEKYPGAAHPDLESWHPPVLSGEDLEHYHRVSTTLFDQTDKALVAAMGPPYELFNGIGQGDFEAWMITFATEDDYVEELYTRLTDAWIENLKAFYGAVGDRLQVLQIADDLGTQQSLFLSVDMFREKVMPFYRRGLDWIHQNTNWKVLLHSDGAIAPLIPSLIEMGVDFLNPIQVSCPGMDPAALRASFGGRIGFWGGSCDSQGTLGNGTPKQVRDEVQRNLDAFHPREGGYVFAPIHNIQANVPPENIIALFDAAMAYHSSRP
jgi:uroporphyrinogen decarboxylase